MWRKGEDRRQGQRLKKMDNGQDNVGEPEACLEIAKSVELGGCKEWAICSIFDQIT